MSSITLGELRGASDFKFRSQFDTLNLVTSSNFATSSCLKFRSNLHRFNFSPRVFGSGASGFGIAIILSTLVKGGSPKPNCKRATLLCRCGAPQGRTCGKAPKCMAQYQSRISGPMLDRIDIQIDIPAVTVSDLSLPAPQEGTKEVAARVARAREIQFERYKEEGVNPALNVVISGNLLEKYATPDANGAALLTKAAEAMRLSARAYHRTLKVARTIADLDGDDNVKRVHIAEALAYRRNDPLEMQGQNIANPNFANKFM